MGSIRGWGALATRKVSWASSESPARSVRTARPPPADASVAFLPRNDLQLDAGANFGLNRETPDVELYAGVSKRF